MSSIRRWLQRVQAVLERWYALLLAAWRPIAAKRVGELAYWRGRVAAEGELVHGHYRRLFTDGFDLPDTAFNDASILDIGCGPRGSLEWATGAACRVGLDPLALLYRKLGTRRHGMRYIAGSSDAIPVASGAFDFITSLNSLDHVDDLTGTIKEVVRALRTGGSFLLMVDVNHEPTVLEPLTLDWDLPARLEPLRPESVWHLERAPEGMARSVEQSIRFDHDDPRARPGILVGRFVKP